MTHFPPINKLLPRIKRRQFHRGCNLQAAKVLNIEHVKI